MFVYSRGGAQEPPGRWHPGAGRRRGRRVVVEHNVHVYIRNRQ